MNSINVGTKNNSAKAIKRVVKFLLAFAILSSLDENVALT